MMASLRRALIFAGKLAPCLLNPGRLAALVLFVTDDCNAKCPHCFNVFLPHLRRDAPADRRPSLTLEEYTLIAARSGPLFQVILSGGEPFLREDIDAIVETFYARAGTVLFSIPTNGSLPGRILGKIERMAANCPNAAFNLLVSLDACGSAHDELRRLPGGFDKAVALCAGALELKARHGNINLIITTAVAEENIDGVQDLIHLLRRTLPADGWHHNIQYDQRLGSRLPRSPALIRKIRAIEDLAARTGGGLRSRLIDRWYVRYINALILHQLAQEKMVYRCAAGRKIAVIMSDGEASPCEPFVFEERYRTSPRFDIRRYQYDFGKVRHDPEFAKLRRFIDERKCAACPWSCAATTSTAFDWRNWSLPFTVPSAGT